MVEHWVACWVVQKVGQKAEYSAVLTVEYLAVNWAEYWVALTVVLKAALMVVYSAGLRAEYLVVY